MMRAGKLAHSVGLCRKVEGSLAMIRGWRCEEEALEPADPRASLHSRFSFWLLVELHIFKGTGEPDIRLDSIGVSFGPWAKGCR
jgi:hypothetical protein